MFQQKLTWLYFILVLTGSNSVHGMPEIRKYVAGHFVGLYSNENSNSFTEQGFGLSFMNDSPVGWVVDGTHRKYANSPELNYNSFEFAIRGYLPSETLYTIFKPSLGYRWANLKNSAAIVELGFTPLIRGNYAAAFFTIGAKGLYYTNRLKEEISETFPQQEVGGFLRLSFPLYIK